ncbi:MAG: RNA methyltransferase [Deltaproteobacteria bacterium]|nr:RNA methyltransferase [Deltaproteobacteria bacterium]
MTLVMNNISIILVEPQSSGNIGSVARAMENTGFSNLVLINPVDYKNNEAYSMACNACGTLLNSKIFTNTEDAIKDSCLVVGATRRKGRERYPVLTLYESIPNILNAAKNNKVSILFGREDKGLKNEEIKLCDTLIEIPAHKKYPSFNLADAVLLVCHALFMAEKPSGPSITLAPWEELDGMYIHLEKTLRKLDYGKKGGAHLLRAIMRSFKRLFGRTGLMQKEVNMLRGICTQIEERVK